MFDNVVILLRLSRASVIKTDSATGLTTQAPEKRAANTFMFIVCRE